MNKPLFSGACTALVTPFLNGEINYPMLERLLQRQMDSGIHAVVIGGTTGEASTLSDREKLELFRRAKEFTGSDCCIIAGTGSNDTAHAIELSKRAEEIGVDALLLVTPYYNKASKQGLISHYSAIAGAVHIPCIVYNVPSRTGLDSPVEVYQTLSRIPNITGVKEASTSISKFAKIRLYCPQPFTLWSGNDDMTAAAMALGAQGVISVVSNIAPVQTQAMCLAALNGDFDTAAALQLKLLPLIDALFSDVNPIPVKAAMKRIGFDCGNCRLPLTDISSEIETKLMHALHQL